VSPLPVAGVRVGLILCGYCTARGAGAPGGRLVLRRSEKDRRGAVSAEVAEKKTGGELLCVPVLIRGGPLFSWPPDQREHRVTGPFSERGRTPLTARSGGCMVVTPRESRPPPVAAKGLTGRLRGDILEGSAGNFGCTGSGSRKSEKRALWGA
jgi:hypothetical protein